MLSQNNILRILKFRISPNLEELRKSLLKLTERHPLLLVTPEWIEDKVNLQYNKEKVLQPIINLKPIQTAKSTDKCNDILEKYSRRCFYSGEGQLFRIALIETGDGNTLLVFIIHLALADSFAADNLIKEWDELYYAHKEGGIPALDKPKNFERFAEWQNKLPESRIDQIIFYWRNKLRDLSYQSLFQPDKKTSPYHAGTKAFNFPEELTTALESFAATYQKHPFLVLLGAFYALIRKYNGQEDQAVLTMYHNRGNIALASVFGPLANPFLLRNKSDQEETFIEFIDSLESNWQEALRFIDMPFEGVKDLSELGLKEQPVTDFFFHYEYIDNPVDKSAEVVDAINPYFCNLNLNIRHQANRIHTVITYNRNICSIDFVESFAANLLSFLEECIVCAGEPLKRISYYRKPDLPEILSRHLPVCTYNYPDQTIDSLFRRQAALQPARIAISYEGSNLTYRELDMKSKQLAHSILNNHRVDADQLIGVMLERSVSMVVSILAILKAGGAYVPIDPAYPQERVDFILNDAGLKLLITTDKEAGKNIPGLKIINPEAEKDVILAGAKISGPSSVKPSDLAYVIYTSGTTSKPKGVLVEHRNVVQLLFPEKQLFDFNNKDVWTLFHSYCFDFSVWEIFGCLLNGGKLVVVPRPTAQDASKFVHLLQDKQVTILNQTPSAFKNLQTALAEKNSPALQVRYVIFGGEALQFTNLKYWHDRYPDCRLINMYGITETTVHNTIKEISTEDIKQGRDTIGRPLPTLFMYVLNNHRQLVPKGGIGELYVGGAGLTRGYLNRPELTVDRFISNPFNEKEKLYKSGDVVQELPDGSLRYLGRSDNQVKIRGHRVELSEIEQTLGRYEKVQSAAVAVNEDHQGNKVLVAHLISDAEIQDVRSFLSSLLPAYMIPAHYIFTNKFPLTSNGKIDYAALPEFEDVNQLFELVQPRDILESDIRNVWQEILQKEGIGVYDHFFEIGGHSLSATQLITHLHKITGVRLDLEDVFSHATIEEQAKLIRTSAGKAFNPVTPVEKKDYYPLSSAQKRLYILNKFNVNSLAYNLPAVLKIEGPLDVVKLEQIFLQLLERHESLRTAFIDIDGRPFQYPVPMAEFRLENYPSDIPFEDLISAFIRPFDLENPPLIRIGVVQKNKEQYLMLIDIHHIIADGQSVEILVRDFLGLYNNEKLPPVSLHYKDIVEWQRNNEEYKRLIEKQKIWWLDKFSTPVEVLELPTDFTRPTYKSDKGATYGFDLTHDESASLRKIARQEGVTSFMLFLALYNVFLHKLTQQEDIVVGVPSAGRTHSDMELILGIFANILPLRNVLCRDLPFREFLADIRRETIEAFQNQDYQFEDLLEALSISREVSRNPLFDAMLVMQPPQKNIDIPGMYISPVAFEEGISKFDLTLYCKETDNKFNLFFEYSTDLFDVHTIRCFGTYFKNIVRSVIQSADKPVRDIHILSNEERLSLLNLSNGQPSGYPNRSIVDIFLEQAEKYPDNIALVYGEHSLTYKELNERSGRLANYIVENYGIISEQLVGLLLQRSDKMVITILGVLKAGAAYVPIEPAYPRKRINFILKDAAIDLLITEEEYCTDNDDLSVLNLKNKEQEIAAVPAAFSGLSAAPEHLAYVIYTSGTTGSPKGVLVEHRNVVQLLFPDRKLFNFGCQDVWPLFHSYSFDVSIWEMFGCLLNGGRLVVVPFDTAQDGYAFATLLHKEQVTVLCQTPSAFKNLQAVVRENPQPVDFAIRYVIFAGEPLQSSTLRYWKHSYPKCRFINMYGITETTIHNTFKELTAEEIEYGRDSIGVMLPTLKAYVLDNSRNPVPLGVTGELYIGGPGVTRGYLNRPELNKERFINSLFYENERLYKSGDLVQLFSDGTMQYIGRVDKQVKIRGYRIELAEIEQTIESHDQIESVVVVAKEDQQGNKFLVAYMVGYANLSATLIRNYLLESLPAYMVPGYYHFMDKLPLTKNGKIDQLALPEVDSLSSEVSYKPITDPLEAEILNLWQQLLNREKIGIRENFFEIGGHSLSANQLIGWLHKITGVKVELREVFNHATVAEQAALIRSSKHQKYSPLYNAEKKASYKLSSAQKRLYVLYDMNKRSLAYNMPAALRLIGEVDKNRLKAIFNELIKRHESLRTSFISIDGEPEQRVEGTWSFRLEEYSSEASLEANMEKFVRPFNLQSAPLIRAGIMPGDDTGYILLIDMHHIVADGISIALLISDFLSIYEGQDLPSINFHYKDYAEWQQSDEAYRKLIQSQKGYWLDKFEDPVEALNLPTAFPRPAVKSDRGSIYSFDLDKEETNCLKQLATREGVTTFMFFLGLYNILLYKLSGQNDIVIGTPSAGRTHADLDQIIGVLANTLPLRNYIPATVAFDQFLQRIKEDTLAAFANQDYQFEELLEDLSISRDISRNPLFDVMLVVQVPQATSFSAGKIQVETLPLKDTTTKFDLILYCSEQEGVFNLAFEYSTDLFDLEAIERFALYLRSVIRSAIENPKRSIEDIDILPDQEKEALLKLFNNSPVGYSRSTIHEQFIKQVKKQPDKVAVVSGETSLTYRELDERSNQLANFIRMHIKPRREQLIGLLLNRSEKIIIAELAVLKAGGAYVPIDPTYPHERIEFIVQDASLELVVTDEVINIGGVTTIDLIKDGTVIEKCSIDQPKVNVLPEDLAYVIYTSGTTGNPKGVQIEHANVMQLLCPERSLFDFNSNDTWALFHSYCFDFSVWEIFACFLNGGRLVVVPRIISQDAGKFAQLMEKEGVTVLNQTPSAFKNLQAAVKEHQELNLILRYVIFGGEALLPASLRQWKERFPGCRLINMYGITETTVVNTFKEIDENTIASGQESIGKPLPTVSAYVLDSNRKLVSFGGTGELYLGGPCMSRGYLNRPSLTAEYFIDNPFESGKRLYKSGDLVQLLPDGSMKFAGRIDRQIKIRGYRIELIEIEQVLEAHKAVDSALVKVQENEEGQKYLIAYMVAEISDPASIREYLSQKLPFYMVPGYYVILDQWPLTKNGKINERALPVESTTAASANNGVEKTTGLQAEIMKIWRDILKRDNISLKDDFFEIGGHSLIAIQLIVKLQKLTGVLLDLGDVFANSTIEKLAGVIESFPEQQYNPIEPVPRKEFYRLSSAQNRLYLLYEMDRASVAYNTPAVFEWKNTVDPDLLESVLNSLIERHESLRTSFIKVNGQPFQKIEESVPLVLEKFTEGVSVEGAMEQFIRPFKLEEAPLVRAAYVSGDGQSDRMLIDMHHIISDAVSVEVLMDDFISLLEGRELPALRLQYKDYSEWQNESLKHGKLAAQKAYWLEEFAEEVAPVMLPYDYTRPKVKNYKGRVVYFELGSEVSNLVQRFCSQEGVTPYILFYAIYNILIYKLSSQRELVIGTPVADRKYSGLEEIVGVFINMLAIRFEIDPEESFLDVLRRFKEKVLLSLDNQEFPFEELIEKVVQTRNPGRHPLFDLSYSFHMEAAEKKEMPFDVLEFDGGVSKYDLSLIGSLNNGYISFSLQYDTNLLMEETINNYVAYFREIVKKIMSDNAVLLRDIKLLSDEEEKALFLSNDNSVRYDSASTIQEVFEQQVAVFPERTALVYEGKSMTYRELNEKANMVARHLSATGVPQSSIIALLTMRSFEMIIAILGVLKSGNAYLPIDPELPENRINTILKDAAVPAVLIHNIKNLNLKAPLLLNVSDALAKSHSKENQNINTKEDDLAYVIYTSGTIGTPCGVMIEHQSILNTLNWRKNYYYFNESNAVLQLPSYAFDSSVEDIFSILMVGGKLVLVNQNKRLDISHLKQLIREEKVNHILIVPQLYKEFLHEKTDDNLSSLTSVTLAGDSFSEELVERHFSQFPDVDLYNEYGPTENSVCSSVYRFNPDDIVLSIGDPIPGVRWHVLDENMHQCVTGVVGELYLEGKGLARGYIGQYKSALFTTNPVNGAPLYATGDRVVRLSHDNLKFLGRIDQDIKIRGNRIDILEIESFIKNFDTIADALVLYRKLDNDVESLHAYLKLSGELNLKDLREHMASHFPPYMIPSQYFEIDKIPLNRNGKVDRTRLEMISKPLTVAVKHILPTNETEIWISNIWNQVLEVEEPSIHDNFFDVGGNSLKAIRVCSLIETKTGQDCPVLLLFEYPTISGLAAFIQNANKDNKRNEEIVNESIATLEDSLNLFNED
jgi:tyrocidine synthetase-3